MRHDSRASFLARNLATPCLSRKPKVTVTTVLVSNSNIDTDDDCDEGPQLVEPNGDEPEFGNTELENLVLLEGPQ